MALINTSQGSSLLQVADGALSQVTDILQRQKSIAVQAGSGSLTSNERTFLNQEFQALTQEIDRLAQQTNFNGVELLNGALFDKVDTQTAENTGQQSEIRMSFNANFASVASADLIINGATITVGTGATDVARGATLTESLNNLAQFLNGSASDTTLTDAERLQLSEGNYSVEGNDLVVTARAGGDLSNNFTIEALTGTGGSTALSTTGLAGLNSIASVTGSAGGDSRVTINALNDLDPADDVTAELGNVVITTSQGTLTVTGGTDATTLQEYVDHINENQHTTGVSARVTGAVDGRSVELIYNEAEEFTVTASGTSTIDSANYGATTGVVDLGLTAELDTDSVAGPFAAGALDINGVTVGTLVAQTYEEVVDLINAATATTGVRASLSQDGAAGNTELLLRSDSATSITLGGAGAGALAITELSRSVAATGGVDDGLGVGRTVATGIVADSVIATQSQTSANISLGFQSVTNASLAAETLTFSDGDSGSVTFTFVASTSANTAGEVGENQVLIGDDINATLDNLVSKINTYQGGDDFGVRQLEAVRNGDEVVLTNRSVGNVNGRDNATAITLALSTGGQLDNASASGTSFNNATTTGVNVSGINNPAFSGEISGFEATYNNSTDRVDLSVTIGDETYTATNVDTTTTTSDETIRLLSAEGGYFDIDLAADQGTAVTSQDNADDFAARIDSAFSGLTFYQQRQVDSFSAIGDIFSGDTQIGSLSGSSLEVQLSDFSDVEVSDVSITAPLASGNDAIIEFTVNGETLRSAAGIGSQIAANSTVKFNSLTNPNEFVEFKTGNTAIQFNNTDNAAEVESALEEALGIGVEGSGESLRFQVGVTTQDTLSVSIDSVTTDKLFAGVTLDVLTQEGASAAADSIDAAIDLVTSVRATVGALQSRFDFAAANVESSIQNQDAARGVLLDTDISAESTAFATAQVQLQAGISVLAQANQLPQNLLKLIG